MPVRSFVNGIDSSQGVRQLSEQVSEVGRIPVIDHHPLAKAPHILRRRADGRTGGWETLCGLCLLDELFTYLAFEEEELVAHNGNCIEIASANIRNGFAAAVGILRCVVFAFVLVDGFVVAVVVDCSRCRGGGGAGGGAGGAAAGAAAGGAAGNCSVLFVTVVARRRPVPFIVPIGFRFVWFAWSGMIFFVDIR